MDPYVTFGLIFTIFYFVFLIVVFPFVGYFDGLVYDAYALSAKIKIISRIMHGLIKKEYRRL